MKVRREHYIFSRAEVQGRADKGPTRRETETRNQHAVRQAEEGEDTMGRPQPAVWSFSLSPLCSERSRVEQNPQKAEFLVLIFKGSIPTQTSMSFVFTQSVCRQMYRDVCYCLYIQVCVCMSADVFACMCVCVVMYAHMNCACGALVSERGSHLYTGPVAQWIGALLPSEGSVQPSLGYASG